MSYNWLTVEQGDPTLSSCRHLAHLLLLVSQSHGSEGFRMPSIRWCCLVALDLSSYLAGAKERSSGVMIMMQASVEVKMT